MKEYPIIFSGPMVRAILEGRKIQTRRVIKPQPDKEVKQVGFSFFANFAEGEIEWRYERGKFRIVKCRCPYGKQGDQLWVRETFATPGNWDDHKPSELLENWFIPQQLKYRATEEFPEGGYYTWRPSIFMPRWASRITLQVERIRVERLQDITEEDAIAEGVLDPTLDPTIKGYLAATLFIDLWNEICAKRGFGWNANPWVWVVEFSTVEVKKNEHQN